MKPRLILPTKSVFRRLRNLLLAEFNVERRLGMSTVGSCAWVSGGSLVTPDQPLSGEPPPSRPQGRSQNVIPTGYWCGIPKSQGR